MGARAGIVVTGTEVLTGRVSDRNGPWLAEQLRRLGVDIGQVIVVGDRPQDLTASLSFLAGTGVDLIITSGGLGPTADDLTAEVVGRFHGRPSALDPELEIRIAAIVSRLASSRNWRMDPDATAAATRKQALVPAGAVVLEPVGTAPGLVVPPPDSQVGPPVVVLPGPPRELQQMWPAAVAVPAVRQALAGGVELRQHTMRLWSTPESELAATLRGQAGRLDGLEITTCMHDGELEIVTRHAPEAEAEYRYLHEVISQAHGDALFSPNGRTVDEQVADGLLEQGWSIATAESCTGGGLAARLTRRAGSSAYLLGGIVAYANEVKQGQLDVPAELIEQVGAVSAEVAEAMAAGARARLGADVGLGITGVAGPGGGTADKPVGLVHLCVSGPAGTLSRRVLISGERTDVQARAVVIAMHLIRQLLSQAAAVPGYGPSCRPSQDQRGTA